MSDNALAPGAAGDDALRENRPDARRAPRTAGNENTSLIKLLAIALMIVDHVGAAFFRWPNGAELRFFGRIAFPLFAWCMAVGMEYTRNVWKYLLRLLIVGIITQPCYMWGLNHTWSQLSVYATLLCGAAGIAAIRVRRFGSQIWGPALALIVPLFVKMDYGVLGVWLILGLYACRKSKGAIACFFSAFCMLWGWSSVTTISVASTVKSPDPADYFQTFTGILLPQDIFFGIVCVVSAIFLTVALCARRRRWWASVSCFALFVLFLGWAISILTGAKSAIPTATSANYIQSMFGVFLPKTLLFVPYAAALWSGVKYLQFWAILALPLMIVPMGRRFRMPQWFWYTAYPGHLLIIAAIRHWAVIPLFFRILILLMPIVPLFVMIPLQFQEDLSRWK